MPLTRVVIEDVGQAAPAESRWLCEMETGQSGTFRTLHLRAGSFEAVLKLVREAYRGEPDPAELAAAKDAKIAAAAEAEAQAAEPGDEVPDIEALRARAEELGVDVDKRWGAARLQTEIDKAAGRFRHGRKPSDEPPDQAA